MKERTLTDAILAIYKLASDPKTALSGSAQRFLCFTLIRVWNEHRRPDEFPVYKAQVKATSSMTPHAALRARNELAEKGYIDFAPGDLAGVPAIYRLTFWQHPVLSDKHRIGVENDTGIGVENNTVSVSKRTPYRCRKEHRIGVENDTIIRGGESNTESIKEEEENTPISPEGIGRVQTTLKKKNNRFSKSFETWWKNYPKKVGKLQAAKAYEKASRMADAEILLNAVNEQSSSSQWRKDGGQFIPNPATWLNQGRWDDEVRSNNENKYDDGQW